MGTRMGPCRGATGTEGVGAVEQQELIMAASAPPLNMPMVAHMFNISGHNVNFVCGLMDESIDQ